jgi:peptidoglycan/LPS O-acetylase OafA/YrhL
MFSSTKPDLKNNAFDFARLLFAFFVVYAHSRYLYGEPDILHWEAARFENLHTGSIGLWGFFAISGFLVTGSYFNSKGAIDFLTKRFKRIFPGFWFSLLMCALFFAPLWYFLKLKTLTGFWDINAIHVWKFLTTNMDALIQIQSIGDVAIDQVNGPYWTIHHEISCYIILGTILALINSLKRFQKNVQRNSILAITLGLSVIRLIYIYHPEFHNAYSEWFGDERFLLFLVVFMWGSTIFLYRELLIPSWAGAFISLFILVLATKTDYLPVVFPCCFTYLVISLCFMLPLRNISRKIGDLSFGVYLYHWPMRLTLQMLGFQQELGLWSFIALNIICTLPLAYLSWHLIEKRFLKHAKPVKNPIPETTECPNNLSYN